MRGLVSRIALFVPLFLLPMTVFADSGPGVSSAIVGRDDGGAIARFTLRFSDAMAPLGAGAPPARVECPVAGAGRWVDPETWVWEFVRPLPGGLACKAELKEGLRTLAGRALHVASGSFAIDSGGPVAKAVMPYDGDEEIEEDQVFFVAVNGPVDRASVAASAYCAVDGIGERIAVDLLPAATTERVFGALRRNWNLRSFLERADLPQTLPAAGRERDAALADIVALKCRRPLPPGRAMSLVWGAGIRAPSGRGGAGRTAGKDQRFDYTVRKEFSARIVCSRVNPQAGCDPVEAIRVEFSAPVPRAIAMAVRLDVGGGKMLAPGEEKPSQTLSAIGFKPPLPASITAHVVLPPNVVDDSGRPLANARRFPLDVAIDAPPPLVKFAAPFGIIEAREGAILPVTVRGVEPALAQSTATIAGGARRIDSSDGAVAGWLRAVARAQENDIREEGEGDAKHEVNHTGEKALLGPGGAEQFSLALPGKGREFEVVGIPLKKPGFYVVELASPTLGRALLGREAVRYVDAAALVTDMSVHFKWGRTASLAWVTSLSSGKPVAGASVQVSDSCSGRKLASGVTGKTGQLLIEGGLPAPSEREDCSDEANTESPPLIVSARRDDDFSFVLTSWNRGIKPSDFDLPYGWSAPAPFFHTIFDRTLLRAGETVHMKHVYRLPTASGFRSGGAAKGTLVIHFMGADTKFELPLTLDANGIGENEWTPPKGIPSGEYGVTAKFGDTEINSDQTFRVSEYRLPTMRASVSGPRAPAVRPRSLPLDLYVGYLSAGGSSHAPVKLRTAFEPLSDQPDGWDGWTFGGRAVREGTVAVDDEEEGEGPKVPAAAMVPLTLDAHGALRTSIDIPAIQDSTEMTVEMDYPDADGETLTASTTIPLYASAIRLGIKPDGWMQRKGDMRLKVAALDLDGRIVRGQDVEVALYTREILSARRRLIGGFYAYDNEAKTTRIAASCTGRTDDHGLVACEMNPGISGEVIAVATTRDAAGNEARAVLSIYLAGDSDWWFGGDNGDRMDVIPDAKTYHAGDTAHVQVRMPFREATALVTVEREGVLSSFVTTLSGKDPVVDVKLPGSDAPDVFISVMAVRGRITGWRAWLAEFAQSLHIPMLDRALFYPTATLDLAKPSYRIGIAKVAVGWEAHRLNVAVHAAREAYRVREHARVAVEVKGPDGKPPRSAEIAFAAVDEALLQLAPNESWQILDAMMGERPLSVITSTAQTQVVGKRHYGRKALATGGGGGGDLSALTRADFRPVLLWRGRVALDAAGRAELDVPLADSLSAYRLVAIATAGDDLFGTGSTTIRSVQDLSLYSGLPPLVRSGDDYVATFTLRNGTQRAMNVTATADLQPSLGPLRPVTVTIPPGGAIPVSWRVIAPEHQERLRWIVAARESGGASDRLQVDEQVAPAVPVESQAATFVRIAGGISVPVAAPPGALAGMGGVEISLAASPAPPLTGVRAYMLAYPYGCFEQRLSKAVALDDRAAWARQMQDLPTYLGHDGLLRYWPSEDMPGSIALTAYALSITAEDGLAWPAEAKEKLLDAMRSVVDGRLKEEGDAPGDQRLLRVAALAALARNGAATPAMVGQAAIPLRDLPTASLADWLVVLSKVPGQDGRRAAADAALRERIVYEGRRLDLVDRRAAPWWMMVSDDEMAIKALLAVGGRKGWDHEAPRMMIGVALRQRGGHWDTTPANAWGTIAVRRFERAYPAASSGVTTARLGGAVERRTWPAPAPILFPLPARPGALFLSHSIASGPWATVSIRAAVPLAAPQFAGYRVSRQMSFLERQRPGRISAGDVIKVRITIEAPVDRTWVVVSDPIPAGASIVSGGGHQSALIAARAEGGDSWPDYVERGLDSWRGYFSWLPHGHSSVEYAVRINNVGRFRLPPTRVEAMYSPEIHAALPNAVLTVDP